ncbi:MAG TPA: helix-turn-helix domain-containing protein [Hyphomicrobium zavarzinii]|jgi:transcriptional regulator with XRE-family HTH domain|nr:MULTISPECIES: helix-turn-helix domain-containing protein [Hyphomicrobium]WBT39773.1 helix-turn-helix domain-containing protein [Hyphomicrobium sp. DMF-1]HML42049.1 helix-turn-helix domain-containing protein [Hyphomicrobium zavarzinii]
MAKRKVTKKPGTKAKAAHLTTGSGAPDIVIRTLENAIGAQVRDYRKHAGLTVSELASVADISSGMLSKIENGQISPSLSTLQLLASALNLPLTMLLATYDSGRGCSYVKKGEGVAIRRRGTKVGHNYQLLGQSLGGDIAVEPYIITLNKDADTYTEFRHEGIEFLYMLSGKVSYAHGDRSYVLEPGDSIMFDSAELHGPDKLIELPAIYLSIIIYERRKA